MEGDRKKYQRLSCNKEACERLAHQYYDLGLSAEGIAKEHGLTTMGLRYHLRMCGHRKRVRGFGITELLEIGGGFLVGDIFGQGFGISRESRDWLRAHASLAWGVTPVVYLTPGETAETFLVMGVERTGNEVEDCLVEMTRRPSYHSVFINGSVYVVNYDFDLVNKVYVVMRSRSQTGIWKSQKLNVPK